MEYIIENLDLYIFIFFSLFCIGFGIMSLTKRKIIWSNLILQVVLMSVVFVNPIKKIIGRNFEILEVILYIGLLIFGVIIIRKNVIGKYTINNMKYDIFVKEFLEEWNKTCRDIYNAEKNIDQIFKKIRTNIIEIDLRTYKNENVLCYEIKNTAREVLDKHNTRYFSFNSIFYIVIGLLFLLSILNKLQYI